LLDNQPKPVSPSQWLTTIEGLKKEIHGLTDEAAKLQAEY